MKYLVRKSVLVGVLLFPSISFCSSLVDEAVSLRARCIANIVGIKTIKFATVTKVESPSAVNRSMARSTQAGGDAVTWDRKGGRSKRKTAGSSPSAQVVDAQKGLLRYLGPDSASVFEEAIAESDALEKAVPAPRWLWNPSWLIPAKPASVRVEGTLIVIDGSITHPKREIRMERQTGHIMGFTDTDANGDIVRVVDASGWAEHNGVWLPGTVREEIRAEKGTLVRTTTLSILAVNPVLGEADFELP